MIVLTNTVKWNISSFATVLAIAFVIWVILMNQTLWEGFWFPPYPDDVDEKDDRKKWEIGFAIFLVAAWGTVWWFMIASAEGKILLPAAPSRDNKYDYLKSGVFRSPSNEKNTKFFGELKTHPLN